MNHLFIRPVLAVAGVLLILIQCRNTQREPETYISPTFQIPDHPRILLNDHEVDSIKIAISIDSTWASVHRVILKECERILSKPPVRYELSGIRLLSVSREARKRIFFLSYAWRLTDDERYFFRAEQELLTVALFKDWNPSHFLDVAEMTFAVSIGYDWLFHRLSDSSRQILKASIINKGIVPSYNEKDNWWLNESTNWNQVCNASLVIGSLAVYEDEPELARKTINRSIESIKLPLNEYEPDGTYPEGYMYWGYGTTFTAYLIDALEKVLGDSYGLAESPGFIKSGKYISHMIGPTDLCFNYSDCDEKALLNPVMFWYSSKFKDNTLLISERNLLSITSDLPWQKDLPSVIIWGTKLGKFKAKEPNELMWVGQGKNPVALMRSSWKRDAIYVGLKGGSPDNNHGHMDIGSFVLDALGERWVMDFGGQNYTSLELKGLDIWSNRQKSQRWEVFRYNNLAHNTLSFNNEHQLVDGYSPIIGHTNQDTFLSASVDLTPVYRNTVTSAVRGIAIVNGQYVAIKDLIDSKNLSATVRWSILSDAIVKITGKSTAELIKNEKRIKVVIVEPENAAFVTRSAQSKNAFDEPNPGKIFLDIEHKMKPGERTTLSVLIIPEGVEGPLEVKEIRIRNWTIKSFKLD